jgi:Type II secretion system (T2SS), protein E, N-terminal domain
MSGASRLSSLLVRDGLIGVKRMEQAFQRQVIYGGALDTILLEMGLVTEERLIEYLSMASGLPPADRNLLEYFDPRAAQVCPRETAEVYRVLPLGFEGEALRVLTIDPVDLGQLENLATQLAIAVQPFVTPEFRYALLAERIYGVPPTARFQTLAAKQSALQRPQAVQPKVLVEDPEVRRLVEIPGARTRTGEMSTDAIRAVVADEERRRAQTYREPATPQPQPESTTPKLRSPSNPPVTVEPQAERPNPSGIVRAPWRGGGTMDPRPLEPHQAAEILAQADDRDVIFTTLVRGVRARARYAALLVVQGETLLGRVAIDNDAVDSQIITQLAIPVTAVPALRSAVETRAPYIGPVAAPGVPPGLFGGSTPKSAAVLPIVIRERVIALVIAHRAPDPIGVAEIADVIPLTTEAASALSRLILKAKSAGYRKPSETAPPPDATVAPKKMPASTTGYGAADPLHVQPALDLATAELPPAELLERIEKGDEGAMRSALLQPASMVPLLRLRFPGKLTLDRYAAGGRTLRAGQHGPLLGLTVSLGQHMVPSLAELLAQGDREIRYYATVCCIEVKNPLLVLVLVGRLFDPDFGVRGAALEALRQYPLREIDPALETVRSSLHADVTKARAAAHALGELCDVGAINDLIVATERDHTTAEEARRALIAITKQDFGTKAKKWRAWYDKNKDRPRIEWMLDGLAHAEDDVRQSASDELKRITGEYFGYHYDLPKREREEARLKWLKWWEEIGRRRFLRDGGTRELERPTALMPTPTARR